MCNKSKIYYFHKSQYLIPLTLLEADVLRNSNAKLIRTFSFCDQCQKHDEAKELYYQTKETSFGVQCAPNLRPPNLRPHRLM